MSGKNLFRLAALLSVCIITKSLNDERANRNARSRAEVMSFNEAMKHFPVNTFHLKQISYEFSDKSAPKPENEDYYTLFKKVFAHFSHIWANSVVPGVDEEWSKLHKLICDCILEVEPVASNVKERIVYLLRKVPHFMNFAYILASHLLTSVTTPPSETPVAMVKNSILTFLTGIQDAADNLNGLRFTPTARERELQAQIDEMTRVGNNLMKRFVKCENELAAYKSGTPHVLALEVPVAYGAPVLVPALFNGSYSANYLEEYDNDSNS